MFMTHKQLIRNLAIKLGVPEATMSQIISALFDEIMLGLCRNEKIKIPRFGTIEIRHKKNSPNMGYIKIVQSRLVKQLLNLVHTKKEQYGKDQN